MAVLAFFGLPGWLETGVLLLLVLLLFNRRLPAAAKGVGLSILEFRKGLRGLPSPPGSAVDQTRKATTDA
ncbi:MAG: hypothetical protein Kow00105_18120 [Phycisphaeraceae bacterium]